MDHTPGAALLLASARGRAFYDVRNAEQFLRADELARLYAAWPAAPERAAIRRAARGLWDWTRCVWAEVERTLGRAARDPARCRRAAASA